MEKEFVEEGGRVNRRGMNFQGDMPPVKDARRIADKIVVILARGNGMQFGGDAIERLNRQLIGFAFFRALIAGVLFAFFFDGFLLLSFLKF